MEHWDQFKFSKGFSLIEMIIVIFIIAILSSVIIFGVSQYINKGKDSNIYANMVILIPAGEKYYEATGNSYEDFCDPNPLQQSSINVIKNAIAQMPININGACYGGSIDNPVGWKTAGSNLSGNPAGLCCAVNSTGNSWVACANEFSDPTRVYCVDSRGIKKSITGACESIIDCTGDACECP